ncbi:Ceramide synthase 1 [Cichlidogyrus casuarinus]|uniref:Ceramide synthase 1 n=1 Tax=Cichlidogyrus casuarinus TaxID=1844966 RepID=A0ABD2Q8Z1_9PLAT
MINLLAPFLFVCVASRNLGPTCSDHKALFARGVKDSDLFSIYNNETQSYFQADRASLVADLVLCRDPSILKRYNPKFINDLAAMVNESQNPSVSEFFSRTKIAFVEFVGKPEIYLKNYAHYRLMIESFDFSFVLHGILIALIFTAIRKVYNIIVIKPLSRKLKLSAINSQKLITSAWFVLAYAFLWLVTLKVVLFSGRDDFYQPLKIFAELVPELGYFRKPIPDDIYWLYAIQWGFYLHALMGLFSSEDGWREDRYVLCLHHVITIALLSFSMFAKFHRIGTLVLFMHDINDVFLEFGKANVYIKFRNNKYHAWHDSVGGLSYVAFVLSWIVTRLYWFPMKVLYITGWGVYISHIGREGFFFLEFNIMLWLLFIMHIYWSYLIGVLAVKILTGQMKNLSDIRETDVDYTSDPNQLKNLHG